MVDFHCEASSEKQGIGFFCDGRASLVVGTHTHVPTADHQILTGGTAYMTDAGMTGDYNSIIGMQKEEPLRRFTTGIPSGRFEPAAGVATLSGVAVETDDAPGLALRSRRCGSAAGSSRRAGVLVEASVRGQSLYAVRKSAPVAAVDADRHVDLAHHDGLAVAHVAGVALDQIGALVAAGGEARPDR